MDGKGAASSSLPPNQQKIFAAYSLSNGQPTVNPSPNVTNRGLSLSTNLGKPGNNGGGKNKHQSIQNIYSEKNQPQILLANKQGNSSNGGNQPKLSQSIDLYKQQQQNSGGLSNLIYNNGAVG